MLDWPPIKALRALKQFPGMGTPGAEKILMFEGAFNQLALDSNGLRVLLRLDLAKNKKPTRLPTNPCAKRSASRPPRKAPNSPKRTCCCCQLGQEVCTRTKPNCGSCPLKKPCPSSRL